MHPSIVQIDRKQCAHSSNVHKQVVVLTSSIRTLNDFDQTQSTSSAATVTASSSSSSSSLSPTVNDTRTHVPHDLVSAKNKVIFSFINYSCLSSCCLHFIGAEGLVLSWIYSPCATCSSSSSSSPQSSESTTINSLQCNKVPVNAITSGSSSSSKHQQHQHQLLTKNWSSSSLGESKHSTVTGTSSSSSTSGHSHNQHVLSSSSGLSSDHNRIGRSGNYSAKINLVKGLADQSAHQLQFNNASTLAKTLVNLSRNSSSLTMPLGSKSKDKDKNEFDCKWLFCIFCHFACFFFYFLFSLFICLSMKMISFSLECSHLLYMTL